MVDKLHKTHPQQVYLLAGEYHLRHARADDAHALMTRALAAVTKAEHVTLLTRFATLFTRHACVERGKTLFESILDSYPRRTDVWLVYADVMLKQGGAGALNDVRGILARATTARTPPMGAHKMYALYKRWIAVEKQYGDAAAVQEVEDSAKKFAIEWETRFAEHDS